MIQLFLDVIINFIRKDCTEVDNCVQSNYFFLNILLLSLL